MKLSTINFDLGNLRISAILNEDFSGQTVVKGSCELQNINLHYHTQFEAFVCQNHALGIYTENGEEEFSNSAVIIPPFYNHYSNEREQAFSFLFDVSKNSADGYDYYGAFTSCLKKEEITSLKIDSKIMGYLFDVYEQPLNPIKIESLLKLVFIRLIELNSKNNVVLEPSFNSYVYSVERIINDNYKEKITLDTVSKRLYLSTKQTSRIIKKNFQKTLNELVKEKRLTVAKILLKESDKNVSEIAELVGFENENYFYSSFKKEFNLTPTEYRKIKAKL